MDDAQSPIQYELAGRVARVTLNRPPLNVIDRSTIAALDAAVVRAEQEGASVLVLSGAGVRAFSAGVAVQDHAPEVVAESLSAFHAVFRRLYQAPFVTVAKVRGMCLGGGCELALFCDVVVAADSARFRLPEIDLACFPPVALSAFPYRFGRGAMDLMLTGRTYGIEDALHNGLVSQWAPRDELDERVDRLAESLASKSAPALAVTVRTARRLWSPGFEKALEEAERVYLESFPGMADHREALAAFLEKRAPDFHHCDPREGR